MSLLHSEHLSSGNSFLQLRITVLYANVLSVTKRTVSQYSQLLFCRYLAEIEVPLLGTGIEILTNIRFNENSLGSNRPVAS